MNPVDIINQWHKITEIYTKRKGSNELRYLSDLFIEDLDKQIKTAIGLDESYITTILVIEKCLNDYLENKDISLKSVVKKQKEVLEFIRAYQDLYLMLYDKEVTEAIDNFTQSITSPLKALGFYNKNQQELLENRYDLAILRLSALQAFSKLRIDQFAKGQNTTVGNLPFANNIYEFYDINLMLKAVTGFNDGMFLSLIRDASDDINSFFAFTIKNGGNVWLVSDKPEFASPIQKHFPRSKSRQDKFDDRVSAHFFPYSLLDVKWDEEKNSYFIQHNSYASTLTNFQSGWKTIGKISDLNPEETLWIFMLFGLFQGKFFSDVPYLANGLSYTGMMIDIPENENNVKAITVSQNGMIKYDPMSINRISFASLNNNNPEVRNVWKVKPTGKYNWAENRYSPQLKDELLNDLILSPGETDIYYQKGTTQLASKERIEAAKNDPFAFAHGSGLVSVPGVELNIFGPEKEVKDWVIWHSRYLQASAIQTLMDKEFEEIKNEIRAWYQAKIDENIEKIYQIIALGEFQASCSVMISGFALGNEWKKKNILRLVSSSSISYPDWGSVKIYGKFSQYYPYYWCKKTGAVASICAKFSINDGRAISELLNIPETEMPVFLQEMMYHEPYSGNSRLDVVDPMEDLRNPWKNLNWDILVFLSKRGYNQICKQFGTTPKIIEKENKNG